jgi:hypothetical protein
MSPKGLRFVLELKSEEGRAHQFSSSHDEKWPWLELSMGGGHDRT